MYNQYLMHSRPLPYPSLPHGSPSPPARLRGSLGAKQMGSKLCLDEVIEHALAVRDERGVAFALVVVLLAAGAAAPAFVPLDIEEEGGLGGGEGRPLGGLAAAEGHGPSEEAVEALEVLVGGLPAAEQPDVVGEQFEHGQEEHAGEHSQHDLHEVGVDGRGVHEAQDDGEREGGDCGGEEGEQRDEEAEGAAWGQSYRQLYLPMHTPSQGQWWSYRSTQWLQAWQWMARSGRQMQHSTQYFWCVSSPPLTMRYLCSPTPRWLRAGMAACCSSQAYLSTIWGSTPGSVQAVARRAARTAACRKRSGGASAAGWKSRRKRSAVRRSEGASMMSTVRISGQIDDLPTVQGALPKGEDSEVGAVPRHQPDHVGADHLSQLQYRNNTTMDEYSFKTAEISPEYLLALSRQVDALSRQYQHLRLGSLTQDFSNALTAEFADLAHYLALYRDDRLMRASSLLHARARLELYTLAKVAALLGRENAELGGVVGHCVGQLREVLGMSAGLVLEERRAEGRAAESEREKVIARLRREVAIKREYTGELEERVRELEDENSQLYSKLITTAKQTSDFAMRGSPAKIKQLLTSTQLAGERPASPRKKVSARAYEEQVVEVLESKFRQESIQERHAPLDEYLRSYFTVKYGKPLAEQNEASFREAVGLLARAQERHIFLLFEAMLEGLCEESYYFEDRQAHERIAKCLKRYLHEKYGRPLHELDRLLDPRTLDEKGDLPLAEADLEPILSNVYKSTEVHTLELILSEVISARSAERGLTCRRLLAEILNYELSKHLLRVEDVVRETRRIADGSTTLTYDQLQQVMVRVVKDKNRYPLLARHAADSPNKRFTVSEVIETIERIRRAKLPPRD